MSGADQHDAIRVGGLSATTEPGSLSEVNQVERRSAALVVAYTPASEQLGTRVALNRDLVLLGREIETGGLCLDDRRMSRTHARFAYDTRAGMFRVGDAHSRNGTFVNGQRVDTRLLSPGDVIRAGESLLVYCELDPMDHVRKQAQTLARAGLNVLVRGETGTGKELLARSLHQQSGRSGAFIAANCASIPSDLVGAEFFGHTKNAFSGATQARKGLFMAAEGGTLLLDEVGDCPPDVQAALLRAIQEKAVRPIGAEREQAVDVRIVAATHAPLENAVERGTFRADLYARLSQATISLPPLRERTSEILPLAMEIAREAAQSLRMTPDVAEALLLWQWPLNVRELQSLVRSFLAMHSGSELDLALLAELAPNIAAPLLARKRGEPSSSGEGNTMPPDPASERSRLKALLEAHGGNVSAVAQVLGKPRAQVYRWMKSMGLSAAKYRR